MKLILTENVPYLGFKDDVVEVKNGYGRNYLIPQGKAIIATPGALRQLEETKKQRATKIAEELEAAKAKAAQLEGLKLTIPAKTTTTGSLYNSIGAMQIADELEKLGHEIDRKFVNVKNPAKEVGVYTATVVFHKEVAVDVEFEVISAEE